MALPLKRHRFALAALVAALTLPATPRACSISTTPVFSLETVPDTPGFTRGDLGIVRASWRSRYLWVAWRVLSKAPLTTGERAAFDAPPGVDSSYEWVAGWQRARMRVPGTAALYGVDGYKMITRPGAYWAYRCAGDDAFRAATRTLERQIATHGPESPWVMEWLVGQDRVFGLCGGDILMPAALGPDAPIDLRLDRDYQLAAAALYAERFDEAEARFRAVAGEAGSIWRPYGRYLAARAMARRATLLAGPDSFDVAPLERALALLDSVARNPDERLVHAASGRLGRFIRIRARAGAERDRLVERLARPGVGDGLEQDLVDYVYLLRRGPPGGADDLGRWIDAMRFGRDSLARARWKATRSRAWLVAALCTTPAGVAGLEPLLDAARREPVDSPAYLTARDQLARLLAWPGRTRAQRDAGRAAIDAIPAGLWAGSSRSTINAFLARRLALARDEREFLKSGVQVPAAVAFDGIETLVAPQPPQDGPTLLPAAGEVVNTLLPVRRLVAVARDTTLLPPSVRARLALATWVRAALLDSAREARELSGAVAAFHPELRNDLAAFDAAPSSALRRRALTWMLLRTPGALPWIESGFVRDDPISEIDAMRNNWWCAAPVTAGRPAPTRPPDEALDAWLGAGERGAARAEIEAIAALGPATDVMYREVLRWAAERPDDPRMPEALHRAIRAVRFTCKSDSTDRSSRRAFTLLKTKYGATSWARKTKYWF